MLNLIKAFWKPIAIIAIITILASVIGINSCIKKKNEAKANIQSEQANTAILRAFLIDSVRTADIKAEFAKLDSIKRSEAQKTIVADAAAKYHAANVNRLRGKNDYLQWRIDSMIQANTSCPEMLDASLELNDSLRSEISELDNENLALDKEAEGYSNQLLLCERQSTLKDSLLISRDLKIKTYEIQIQNLQCYREWGIGHPFLKWMFGWKCRK